MNWVEDGFSVDGIDLKFFNIVYMLVENCCVDKIYNIYNNVILL